MFNESRGIVPYQPSQQGSWFLDRINALKAWPKARKERRAIIDRNRIARERLSSTAERLRDVLDSPQFRGQEGVSILSLSHPQEAAHYMAWVQRHDDGRSFSIWVNTRPLDQTHYTTGFNDGDWFLHYRKPFGEEERKEARLKVWEGRLKGNWYLGKRYQTADYYLDHPLPIDSINVTHDYTQIELPRIEFGGHPSVHIWLKAWSVDPKTGEVIGPIGRIREAHVLALSRKLNPTGGKGVTDAESFIIPLTDDFEGQTFPIQMPRGDIDLSLVRREGKLGIHAKSLWQSPPDRQLFIGNRPVSYEGPTEKTLILPSEYLNGFTVIDHLDRAVNNFIEAYLEQSPKQLRHKFRSEA